MCALPFSLDFWRKEFDLFIGLFLIYFVSVGPVIAIMILAALELEVSPETSDLTLILWIASSAILALLMIILGSYLKPGKNHEG